MLSSYCSIFLVMYTMHLCIAEDVSFSCSCSPDLLYGNHGMTICFYGTVDVDIDMNSLIDCYKYSKPILCHHDIEHCKCHYLSDSFRFSSRLWVEIYSRTICQTFIAKNILFTDVAYIKREKGNRKVNSDFCSWCRQW